MDGAIARRRKTTRSRWRASRCTTSCCEEYPNTLLHASDHFVGLPDGQMGNSEVGHLNIGAGRIVQMDITRIDALIASGEFFTASDDRRGVAESAEDAAASVRAGVGRRRALAPGAFVCAAEGGEAAGRGEGFRTRLYGRTRHAADERSRVPGGARTEDARSSAGNWPAFRDAITRWIATGAGSARRRLSTRW